MSINTVNIEYLDVTSDAKKSYRKTNKLTKSVDYLTKEELGQVHAGGFLHDHLLAMRKQGEPGPANLENEIRKERIKIATLLHLKNYQPPKGVIAHKFVLSMSSAMPQNGSFMLD